MWALIIKYNGFVLSVGLIFCILNSNCNLFIKKPPTFPLITNGFNSDSSSGGNKLCMNCHFGSHRVSTYASNKGFFSVTLTRLCVSSMCTFFCRLFMC